MVEEDKLGRQTQKGNQDKSNLGWKLWRERIQRIQTPVVKKNPLKTSKRRLLKK